MNKITLNIDGRELQAKSGQSLLSVARENGIYIPTLCYHPRTKKAGKCRICVVAVEGLPGLQVSCSLAAADGMIVHTYTKKIIETRKMIVELYLASGKHDCPTCEADGECELQDVAKVLGIEKSGFPMSDKGYVTDSSSPMIIRDMNKCIHCYRCIVGCNDLVVNEVIEMGYRGSRMTVVCDLDSPMGDSSCVICGECVQLCPTGALTEKKAAGKESNRDTVKVRTTCPYCGVGCQIFLHVRDNEILKVTGVEAAKPNYGSLCIKGRFGYDFVNSHDRLKSPLVRKDGKLVEVSWDEALDYTAKKLSQIKNDHGPDSIVGIGCARTTNEDNYLMMKLMRGVIGTNNVDHCART
ncbi:putative formate dehydrogenase [bacterium BMS3Abin09]|nr:putative formate dehydrogenase [bacterium BMS3Abin09]GBE41247.1 putative formate dehydrogenase [bacterium BMS3Bbin09]HDO67039.1 2Fe-2S iron-sulfur cluster binding domain-containing protein [Nitrospirota bacterium]HEW81213.1 2Fe-2S iron-sulfur cluster binding domain-containing protein [Nitrospirota bacterium]